MALARLVLGGLTCTGKCQMGRLAIAALAGLAWAFLAWGVGLCQGVTVLVGLTAFGSSALALAVVNREA